MKDDKLTKLTKYLEEIRRDRLPGQESRMLDTSVLKISQWRKEGKLFQSFQMGSIYSGWGELLNLVSLISKELGSEFVWPFEKTYVNDVELIGPELTRLIKHVRESIEAEEE